MAKRKDSRQGADDSGANKRIKIAFQLSPKAIQRLRFSCAMEMIKPCGPGGATHL